MQFLCCVFSCTFSCHITLPSCNFFYIVLPSCNFLLCYASLAYFPFLFLVLPSHNFLLHCASLAQFPATLCFPRTISCHVTLPSRNFLLHCASLAQFPATLHFPRVISAALCFPCVIFTTFLSCPVSRRYSHPSLPHHLPQACHDMWVTYRQLPCTRAATIASDMFHCSFLRRPPPFFAHFDGMSKPSFVVSPPTHRVSPLNHRFPKILGDHYSP